MEKKETIHFIITGGTIDSVYDGSKDTAVPSKHTSIPDFMKILKSGQKFVFTEICMKDSRDLTQSDRKKMLNAIEKSPYKNIIITHGTYTMPDSGKYIESNLKRKDQKIILTGSLIPLIGFSPSDAPFNLGYSIAKIQHIDPGIYVSMNSDLFSPDEVIKILNEGRFTSVFSK